jgi:hypothetical protein
MQKPGWQTTEFWVTVLVVVGDVVGALTQHIPTQYTGIASAVAAGLYAVSRGLAKVTLPPPTA